MRMTPKPHFWVGAFVLPLSDDTAELASRHLREHRKGQPPGAQISMSVRPVMLDVYCEHCRQSFGKAGENCWGNSDYAGNHRRRNVA